MKRYGFSRRILLSVLHIFNLSHLVHCLFNKQRDVPERFKEIFKEKVITELYQDTLFNGPLYAKYFGEDEYAVERIEIERVIE